jgi:hypothetical protein
MQSHQQTQRPIGDEFNSTKIEDQAACSTSIHERGKTLGHHLSVRTIEADRVLDEADDCTVRILLYQEESIHGRISPKEERISVRRPGGVDD